MPTDYHRIIRNLLDFADFAGQTLIAVGAGGGQLVEYGRPAAKVIAVDEDQAALAVLWERAVQAGLADKFVLTRSDFMEFKGSGDIVVLEFCLHEMPDRRAALAHARSLAPRVVVMDHWPGSEWAFMVSEEDKAAAAWTAVMASRPVKTVSHEAVQVFKTYQELRLKVEGQGEKSLARIERFRGRTDIAIPMSYGFALLASTRD